MEQVLKYSCLSLHRGSPCATLQGQLWPWLPALRAQSLPIGRETHLLRKIALPDKATLSAPVLRFNTRIYSTFDRKPWEEP